MIYLLDYYQEEAAKTRLPGADFNYCVLNLAAEAGEVAGLVAKARRDNTLLPYDKLEKELGDVLWQLAMVAADSGFKLSEIATANIEKLQSRQQRGTLGGSGDDR